MPSAVTPAAASVARIPPRIPVRTIAQTTRAHEQQSTEDPRLRGGLEVLLVGMARIRIGRGRRTLDGEPADAHPGDGIVDREVDGVVPQGEPRFRQALLHEARRFPRAEASRKPRGAPCRGEPHIEPATSATSILGRHQPKIASDPTASTTSDDAAAAVDPVMNGTAVKITAATAASPEPGATCSCEPASWPRRGPGRRTRHWRSDSRAVRREGGPSTGRTMRTTTRIAAPATIATIGAATHRAATIRAIP